ncbi:DNA repair helicase [Palaeococcus pacificus DY20341]|uniref:DNA 5'-3' helicase n=1 Tax=Palaeococcus pacificus DY20341 TaxID=1343739 RepID=A0A075LTQ9_9EURY|nr:helicase C-terminal domain-containing protein [Palaeococcus pacificus]AIF69506.1 DNA repair helicase [Palaeococcus pacificus DY20341]
MSDYFPYGELRPNQKEFIKLVDEAVRNGENIIIEAPTGFGKTISVLAGVLPYAKQLGYKVLYLARTHKQMDRVIEELKAINAKTPVSGVGFRSRKDLCLHTYILNFAPDAYNAMIVCKNLRELKRCSFYENVKKKKEEFDEIANYFLGNPSEPAEILKYSEMLDFCPYELTRKVAFKADVIVASYLYMISPPIRENFLKYFDLDTSDLIVIFDEAHNLPNQAINALSDKLSIISISRAIKEAEEYNEHEIANFLSVFLRGVEKLFTEKLEAYSIEEVPITPESLFVHLHEVLNINSRFLIKFLNEMVEVGDAIREDKIEKNKPPRSYIGRVGEFLLSWIMLKDREDYLFMLSRNNGFFLELVALDPSKALEPIKNVRSAIFMSGTLSPMEAFRDIMGISGKLKKFPRMIKRENALVLVAKDVSTRGAERSMENYKKMADYIVEASKLIPKNVGVFTASYEVLEGLISANLPLRIQEEVGKRVFIEKRNAPSRENDRMVRAFKEASKEEGGVLLGVMGGRNSEGQDYVGDEMNGVVLVGIPYSRPTSRVEAQIRYFEKKFPNKGRYYGYYLPAHRKLAQAAGRVHRSEEDKGAVVILDYRASWGNIKRDLPDWMVDSMRVVNLERMKLYLKRFYK